MTILARATSSRLAAIGAPRRVGVVMLTAVGDAVHVLPVVTAIKRNDPTTHITWVLQPGPATLVRGHPAVDEIITFDRRAGWRAFADIRRTLRERPFDVTLALQDYLKAGIITRLTRAPVRLGYDRARARDLNWLFTNCRIPAHAPQHIQDEYLEFVAALGIPTEPVTWALGPWPEERAWQRDFAARFDRPIAALVIGSSRPEKDWVPERWVEVVDALTVDFGLQPVLVGGRSPREAALERFILEHAHHPPVSALDSGLRRLVGILDAAALVVSLDTGPLHMAVALDRPVVSLIGFSNPARTGPYRKFHDLIVNAYGETMRNGRLCTDRRPQNTARITTREVLAKVELWRTRYAGTTRSGDTRAAP
ncbi:MAG: glycosyltransferase family 9 protein [Gemmatimonadaceae bacterium]|nr:glycosyltransferase family 9 protein [Gemmatimonadaceae bacterium]